MALPLRHLVHLLVHALALVQSSLIGAQTGIRLIEDVLRAKPEAAHRELRLELRAHSHELSLAIRHLIRACLDKLLEAFLLLLVVDVPLERVGKRVVDLRVELAGH